MADSFFDLLVAGAAQEAFRQRVEQTAARAEREVDRRPGDLRPVGDLVHAHRLGRRLTQPVVERIEDPPARLFGARSAQTLPVWAPTHAPDTTVFT